MMNTTESGKKKKIERIGVLAKLLYKPGIIQFI